jgi:DNA-binding PadR family transcriptional regulator
MSARQLTTTSYALLGLLAIQDWNTYELSRQMERSMRRFWPRAESNMYGAAKSLVDHGLATDRRELNGRRAMTVYSITDEGRKALSDWVVQPAASNPVLEFEALLKIFFSEHGTNEGVRHQLLETSEWARAALANGREIASSYLSEQGPFNDRLPQIRLIFKFVWDYHELVSRWADWALSEIDGYGEDPAGWPDQFDVFRDAIESRTVSG